MPQPHYAYPEMLIVLASIWLAWKFIGMNMRLGAAGSVLFCLAAALGVYRFLSGQIVELAEVLLRLFLSVVLMLQQTRALSNQQPLQYVN